ncbi:hypothetical protein IW262DRAFT_1463967 [Armillaria fumosa]|nr:hypothetical protein IW262DRAFT_1463967 [Armillaria fumosa]
MTSTSEPTRPLTRLCLTLRTQISTESSDDNTYKSATSGDPATNDKGEQENPCLHSAHASGRRIPISPLRIPEVNNAWPEGSLRAIPSTWELQIEPGHPSHYPREWPTEPTDPRPGPFKGQTTSGEEESMRQWRNIETDITSNLTRSYGGMSSTTAPFQGYTSPDYDQELTRRNKSLTDSWQLYSLPGEERRPSKQSWPNHLWKGTSRLMAGSEEARPSTQAELEAEQQWQDEEAAEAVRADSHMTHSRAIGKLSRIRTIT